MSRRERGRASGLRSWLLPVLTAAALLTGCGAGPPADEDPEVARGRALYLRSCTLCHGPGGEGKPGLGRPLKDNDFIAIRSQRELVEFLKVGRRASDPANRSGVLMPPRGGNPRLSEADLAAISAYLQSLQE